MKQFFRNAKLSKTNLASITQINEILTDYKDQGYTLTLRQLYYQLVSRNIIPNEDKEYGKLSYVLKEARMAGLVDWSSIEDRVRVPKIPYWVSGVDNAIDDTISQYRLDRMLGQDTYIEVWIEKDALSSVFYRVTRKYGIRLMVNRGFSSTSAMYTAANRFKYNQGDLHILYFGDHDPSGLDMVRDIEDRMIEFNVDLSVTHCALTMDQVNQYNPPPNPAKVKDPRAKNYIATYGSVSWELDALQPSVLEALVDERIKELIDWDTYRDMLEQEEVDIKELESFKS